jgi:hypothetical protein
MRMQTIYRFIIINYILMCYMCVGEEISDLVAECTRPKS